MANHCPGVCDHGPGYPTPMDAMKGPKEKILFVTCPNSNGESKLPDMIVTVDVDPESETFCQIIGILMLPNLDDEVHHTGWNACSSCHSDVKMKRSHLVVPCLKSSRIYFVDTSDPKALKLHKVIEGSELHAMDVSFPHTAHCLADANIMISTLGNAQGENEGNFVLIDGKTFEPKGKWPANGKGTKFGYDFWYQPRQNVMISTEWGRPNDIVKGFDPSHINEGRYGNELHIWNWETRALIQSINLEAPLGLIPLEVRFMHNPAKAHAFVGTALGSAIYHLYRKDDEEKFSHQVVASIPAKKVKNWALPEMPALITDILVSMDDRFLYCSCWLHGDIRQYDISDPFNVRLVGQCFVGGSIHTASGVDIIEDLELKSPPEPVIFDDGKMVHGGPQMLQLSLDGKRLYVTTSLFSVWDKQFYPELVKNGAVMLQLDVNTEQGGLTLNKKFKVDFSKTEKLPDGPYLAHEMRYPGGDCTSDIWI